MVWSMIFCSVTSWLAAVLMMWCAGDWETYMLASQPYMNWWMDILGSVYGGGVFCALIMIGLNVSLHLRVFGFASSKSDIANSFSSLSGPILQAHDSHGVWPVIEPSLTQSTSPKSTRLSVFRYEQCLLSL